MPVRPAIRQFRLIKKQTRNGEITRVLVRVFVRRYCAIDHIKFNYRIDFKCVRSSQHSTFPRSLRHIACSKLVEFSVEFNVFVFWCVVFVCLVSGFNNQIIGVFLINNKRTFYNIKKQQQTKTKKYKNGVLK